MRNPGLDLLRLLAVLLVMGRHLASPDGCGQLTEGVFSPLIRGGWIGVDIFFVLSGFLISALLFREYKTTGSINVPRFLIRRGLKIYPAYWCLLLPTIAFCFLNSRYAGVELPTRKMIGELLFMQNYLGSLWVHTWSLAIEEHFYIGFVVLLSVVGYFYRGLEWVPRLCTFTFVLCLALRLLVWQSTNGFNFDAQWTPTHLRIDSLMAGVLLSYAVHFYKLDQIMSRIPTWLFSVVGASLLIPAFIFPHETTWWIPVFGFTLFYTGAMLLVYAAYRVGSLPRPLGILQSLGMRSYSIYLWHLPIASAITHHLLQLLHITNYWLYVTVYVALSLAFGCWAARLFEFPVLALRDRIFPAAQSLPATPIPAPQAVS